MTRPWQANLWLAAVLTGAFAATACGGVVTGAAGRGVTTGTAGNGTVRSGPPVARTSTPPGGDWPTFDYDAQRSGVGPATGITSRNVRGLQLRVVHINGTVDSSAVELHGVRVRGRVRDAIFATTSYGRTIAIDPGTGGRLWEYTPAGLGRYDGSDQVTTASPVLDPDRRNVYAATPDGRIHKLSVATGSEVRSGGWPARVTLDPVHEKIASALNVSGTSVIVAVGGYYGDAPVYQGHLVLIDHASGRIAHVFNALCSDRHQLIDPPSACPQSGAAIWGRAGEVVEPGSGRLATATGNGDFNGHTDWGDSVLELSPTLSLLRHWTPRNQAELSANDIDLGSTVPALVTISSQRLALQGGKAGVLDLLDLGRLYGTTGRAGSRPGGRLQQVSSPGSADVLTQPAVWTHDGRSYVFVTDDSGTSAYLMHGGAHPHLSAAWQSSTPGTSPVLAGGLLYVFDQRDGTLEVYAPVSGARIASLPAGVGHWNSPIVAGGRIILPIGNYHARSDRGELLIWHLPGR